MHNNNTIITCATAVCFCFYLSFPTPPTNRSHTRAYVARMKDNVSRSFEPRHVIPDTRISSGQCPRCDVIVTLGERDVREISKVTRNKRAVRHIHVRIGYSQITEFKSVLLLSLSADVSYTLSERDSKSS
jgi:hypothetical protein